MQKQHLFFKSTAILIIGILIIITQSSYSGANDNLNTFTIPVLLDRASTIQYDAEWSEVQNQYAKQCNQLLADPSKLKPKLALAQLFIREARVTGEHGHYYPAALKLLDHMLVDTEIDHDMRFLAMSTKAGVQLSLHDFQLALKTGNEAALLNPANAQIHGVLIDANVELGRYDKAIELADRMVKIKPDIRSYSRISYLREIFGDVSGSMNAMMMAVKAGYPGLEETAWAKLTLGNLHLTYGNLDRAESIFHSILKDRPNYPFAVAALGDVFLAKNHLEKAKVQYQTAIDIIPEVGFYVSLAKIYQMEGLQDKKEHLVKEILLMLADDEAHGHNMDLAYAHLYLDLLNDPDQALIYANKAFRKRPNNIDVNRLMAKIYANKNEKMQVEKHLALASRTNSKDPELVALKFQL